MDVTTSKFNIDMQCASSQSHMQKSKSYTQVNMENNNRKKKTRQNNFYNRVITPAKGGQT